MNVVFDLGGVLIEWDPRHLYRELFDGDEAAMETFLATVCTPEWNHAQDAGRPWAEAVQLLTGEFPEQAELIAAYDTRWAEMVRGPIPETVKVLAELHDRGTPLYALTNWSADKFALTRPRFAFLRWFRGIVVSGEVGLAKPDPRIFRHLLDLYRLEPAETVYVDDAPANVQEARAQGLHALRFTDAQQLRRDLVSVGVLPALPAG